MSSWSEWTDCTSSCGLGTQSRERSVLTVPSSLSSSDCPNTLESTTCMQSICPVDCDLSPWSDWSACSSSCGMGSQSRSRQIATQPSDSGFPCAGLSQNRNCYAGICDSTASSCEVSDWASWSDCPISQCGSGTQLRARSVSSPPLSTDSLSNCPELYQSQSCELTTDCSAASVAAPCIMSNWSTWSTCSTTCGGGIKSRTRTITQSAGVGGYECDIVAMTVPCIVAVCDRDCELSVWSGWSNCLMNDELSSNSSSQFTYPISCIPGSFKSRARSLISDKSGIGVACVSFPELREIGDCISDDSSTSCLDINCAVSEWQSWSDCTPSSVPSDICSSTNTSTIVVAGTSSRSRSVTVAARGSGASCPVLQDIDSTCSVSLNRTSLCSGASCSLTVWSEWSGCIGGCGLGVQTRTREALNPSTAPSCSSVGLQDVLVCPLTITNEEVMSETCRVDCGVSSWSSWSTCTVTCGGGTQQRARSILVLPLEDGAPCPDLVDVVACGTRSCGSIDCEVSDWSEWSTCPATCGGGVTKRSRSITSTPKTGGNACPTLEQSKGCNTFRCPGVACANSALVTSMGLTCDILKVFGCSTVLKDLAASQNTAFPDTIPPETRISDACPVSCSVCSECATDCQLRDLGDGNCQQSCMNEACQYDNGDCEETTDDEDVEEETTTTSTNSSSEDDSSAPAAAKMPHGCITGETYLNQVCTECGDLDSELKAAGLSCDDLKSYLGCEVPLSAYQLPLPTGFTTVNTKVGHLCGSTCSWCDPVYFLNTTSNTKVINCATSCSRWLHGNGICDAPCDNAACDWDNNDCLGADEDPCIDSLYISETLGFECSLLQAFAQKISPSEPCELSLEYLLGDAVDLPYWITNQTYIESLGYSNKSVTLGDACSVTCNFCSAEVGSARIDVDSLKPLPTTTFNNTANVACHDFNTFAVAVAGGRVCKEIRQIIPCERNLKDSGIILPLPWGTASSLFDLCPETCGACDPVCSEECPSWFLRNNACDQLCYTASCSYDYGDCGAYINNTSQMPDWLAEIINANTSSSSSTSTTTATANSATPTTSFNGKITECADQDTLTTAAAAKTCAEIIAALPQGCNFLLSNLSTMLSSYLDPNSPAPDADATLALLCPKTCNLCGTSCSSQCPDWFKGNKVCDVGCNNNSCSYDDGDCAGVEPEEDDDESTVSTTLNPYCKDDDGVREAGFTCRMMIAFAGASGCSATISAVSLSSGRSLDSLTSNDNDKVLKYCQLTCGLCGAGTTYIDGICADSARVSETFLTSCSDLLSKGQSLATGVTACEMAILSIDPNIATLSKGNITSSNLLRDICPYTCGLCDGVSACDDGFKNGDEAGVDCGGSCERECKSCEKQADILKMKIKDDERYIMSFSSNSWPHDASRVLKCSNITYEGSQSTSVTQQTIRCTDGYLSSITIECNYVGTWAWGGLIEFGGKEGDLMDITIVPAVFSAISSGLSLQSDEILYITQVFTDTMDSMSNTTFNSSSVLLSDLLLPFTNNSTLSDEFIVSKQGGSAIDPFPSSFMSLKSLKKALNPATYSSGDVLVSPGSSYTSTPVTSCVDDPRMAMGSYDCPKIVSLIGCSMLLSTLVNLASVTLPDGVDGSLTVGEACAVSCNTCSRRRRLNSVSPVSFEVASSSSATLKLTYIILTSRDLLLRGQPSTLISSQLQTLLSSSPPVYSQLVPAKSLLDGSLIPLSVASRNVEFNNLVVMAGNLEPFLVKSRLLELHALNETDIYSSSQPLQYLIKILGRFPGLAPPITNKNTSSCSSSISTKLENFFFNDNANSCTRLIFAGKISKARLEAFCLDPYPPQPLNYTWNTTAWEHSIYGLDGSDLVGGYCFKAFISLANEIAGEGEMEACSSLVTALSSLPFLTCSRQNTPLMPRELPDSDTTKDTAPLLCLNSLGSSYSSLLRSPLAALSSKTDSEISQICEAKSCYLYLSQYLTAHSRVFHSSEGILRKLRWLGGWNAWPVIDSAAALGALCAPSSEGFYCQDVLPSLAWNLTGIDRLSSLFSYLVSDSMEFGTLLNSESFSASLSTLSAVDSAASSLCADVCVREKSIIIGGVMRSIGIAVGHPGLLIRATLLDAIGSYACSKTISGRYCSTVGLSQYGYNRANEAVITDSFQNSLRMLESTEDVDSIAVTIMQVRGLKPTCVCPTGFIGDGVCDAECYNDDCAFDGGDCTALKILPNVVKTARVLIGAARLCIPSSNAFYSNHTSYDCSAGVNDTSSITSANGAYVSATCSTFFTLLTGNLECCSSQIISLMRDISPVSLRTAINNHTAFIYALGTSSPSSFSASFTRSGQWSIPLIEKTCAVSLDSSCSSEDSFNVEVKSLVPIANISIQLFMNAIATALDSFSSGFLSASSIRRMDIYEGSSGIVFEYRRPLNAFDIDALEDFLVENLDRMLSVVVFNSALSVRSISRAEISGAGLWQRDNLAAIRSGASVLTQPLSIGEVGLVNARPLIAWNSAISCGDDSLRSLHTFGYELLEGLSSDSGSEWTVSCLDGSLSGNDTSIECLSGRWTSPCGSEILGCVVDFNKTKWDGLELYGVMKLDPISELPRILNVVCEPGTVPIESVSSHIDSAQQNLRCIDGAWEQPTLVCGLTCSLNMEGQVLNSYDMPDGLAVSSSNATIEAIRSKYGSSEVESFSVPSGSSLSATCSDTYILNPALTDDSSSTSATNFQLLCSNGTWVASLSSANEVLYSSISSITGSSQAPCLKINQVSQDPNLVSIWSMLLPEVLKGILYAIPGVIVIILIVFFFWKRKGKAVADNRADQRDLKFEMAEKEKIETEQEEMNRKLSIDESNRKKRQSKFYPSSGDVSTASTSNPRNYSTTNESSYIDYYSSSSWRIEQSIFSTETPSNIFCKRNLNQALFSSSCSPTINNHSSQITLPIAVRRNVYEASSMNAAATQVSPQASHSANTIRFRQHQPGSQRFHSDHSYSSKHDRNSVIEDLDVITQQQSTVLSSSNLFPIQQSNQNLIKDETYYEDDEDEDENKNSYMNIEHVLNFDTRHDNVIDNFVGLKTTQFPDKGTYFENDYETEQNFEKNRTKSLNDLENDEVISVGASTMADLQQAIALEEISLDDALLLVASHQRQELITIYGELKAAEIRTFASPVATPVRKEVEVERVANRDRVMHEFAGDKRSEVASTFLEAKRETRFDLDAVKKRHEERLMRMMNRMRERDND